MAKLAEVLTCEAAHAAAHQHAHAGLVQCAVAIRVGTLLQASSLQRLRQRTVRLWAQVVAPRLATSLAARMSAVLQAGATQLRPCGTFLEATMVYDRQSS